MKRLVLLIVAVFGLTACGGSGGADNGGGGAEASVPTPVGTTVSLTPLKSVFLGTSAGSQYSFPAVFGTDSLGRSWSGSFSVVADGLTTFEGLSVTKCRTLMTLQLVGGTPVSVATTSYYKASDGSPYKSVSSAGTTHTATNQAILPTSVKVGDFGTFIADSGSDGTTTTSTWALNSDYNGASKLVFSSIIKTGTIVTGTEVESFYLDSLGVPTKMSVSFTVNGITVNLSGSKL